MNAPPQDNIFTIAFVCTANRFRSPLAAAVLAEELEGLPVRILSRGVLDVGAMPPLSQALLAATELGLDLSRHRARQLSAQDLSDSGLIIGFEKSHLDAAERGGAKPEAIFGLEEAVAALQRLDRSPAAKNYAASVRHAITVANRLREPEGDLTEIQDPVGKPPKEAAAIARRIHSLSLRLGRLLSP
jgi:protein-tyrosine-phosphatase